MPTGSFDIISPVLGAIETHYQFSSDRVSSPKILDVGVGTGKWGVLMREYFSFWYRSTENFREAYLHTYIEGIEAYKEYSNPIWSAYNHVHCMTVTEFLEIDKRDWVGITCMDVIEHLEDKEANWVLKELCKRTKGFITLSFPAANDPHALEQGAAWGNKYETHRSLWSIERCRELVPEFKWISIIEKHALIGLPN